MSRQAEPEDSYGLKILKFLPAEATAAYSAINIALKEYSNRLVLVLSAIILAVACYYLIKWQTNDNRQATATSVAFLVWAANVSAFIYFDLQETALLACLLALTTFFLPWFVVRSQK